MQRFISPVTQEWSGDSQGYRYCSGVPPSIPIHLVFQLWTCPWPLNSSGEHHLGTADDRALFLVEHWADKARQAQSQLQALCCELFCFAWMCNQSEGEEDQGFVLPFSLNKCVCTVQGFGTPTGSGILLMSWRNLTKRLWHENLALYRKWQLMAGEPRGWVNNGHREDLLGGMLLLWFDLKSHFVSCGRW